MDHKQELSAKNLPYRIEKFGFVDLGIESLPGVGVAIVKPNNKGDFLKLLIPVKLNNGEFYLLNPGCNARLYTSHLTKSPMFSNPFHIVDGRLYAFLCKSEGDSLGYTLYRVIVNTLDGKELEFTKDIKGGLTLHETLEAARSLRPEWKLAIVGRHGNKFTEGKPFNLLPDTGSHLISATLVKTPNEERTQAQGEAWARAEAAKREEL